MRKKKSFILSNKFLFYRRKGELQIIGAISIDLNGVVDEMDSKEMNQETKIQVCNFFLKIFPSFFISKKDFFHLSFKFLRKILILDGLRIVC